MFYEDRADAGRRLAKALSGYKVRKPVIIALPRGGVPVAAEVAKALDAPLDLMIVRKIGVPFQPEVAMGAIAEGDPPTIVRNEDVIGSAGVTDQGFQSICREKLEEIKQRQKAYCGDRERIDLAGRTVIVVDDGIATGATMKAALRAVRRQKPKGVVLAVPVAPSSTIAELKEEVDAVICLDAPEPFYAVGQFYHDFRQTSDAEVIEALNQSAVVR